MGTYRPAGERGTGRLHLRGGRSDSGPCKPEPGIPKGGERGNVQHLRQQLCAAVPEVDLWKKVRTVLRKPDFQGHGGGPEISNDFHGDFAGNAERAAPQAGGDEPGSEGDAVRGTAVQKGGRL